MLLLHCPCHCPSRFHCLGRSPPLPNHPNPPIHHRCPLSSSHSRSSPRRHRHLPGSRPYDLRLLRLGCAGYSRSEPTLSVGHGFDGDVSGCLGGRRGSLGHCFPLQSARGAETQAKCPRRRLCRLLHRPARDLLCFCAAKKSCQSRGIPGVLRRRPCPCRPPTSQCARRDSVPQDLRLAVCDSMASTAEVWPAGSPEVLAQNTAESSAGTSCASTLENETERQRESE